MMLYGNGPGQDPISKLLMKLGDERMDIAQNAGGEEKTTVQKRLEKEQDKAALAKELLDVAVPFVTIENATLDTNDVIDVFVDVVERLRSSLHGEPYTYDAQDDAYPPF